LTGEERIVAALRRTRKYGALDAGVLAWAAREALRRVDGEKDALDLARRKLHEVSGAFVDAAARKRILRALAGAAASEGETWRDRLREALDAHVSSSERGADPGASWRAILAHTGPVRSVLDLGCGVHPLTLPWSGLDRDVRYEGWDLDGEVCAAVERALVRSFPGVRIRPADVLGAKEYPEVDLVLVLKLAPTLERQRSGALSQLWERLRARTVAVSWPRRSLGGRRRFEPPPAPDDATATVTLGDEIVQIRKLAP